MVKLKAVHSVKGWSHYLTVISRVVTSDGEDRVDSAILGVDITGDDAAAAADDDDDDDDDEDENANVDEAADDNVGDDALVRNAATVGLILPVTTSMSVSITGQRCVCVPLDIAALLIICQTRLMSHWWSGVVVSALASINEVNQRRARLVLRWATVFGFNSRWRTFISVCNQPATQGQLSLPSLRGR